MTAEPGDQLGPVPGVVALHLRITDVLVHGWDLALTRRWSA
jgi:hypothetical protein